MVTATKPELKLTSVFEKNLLAYQGGKRRALNEGGTSSSKTFSILQLLHLIAEHTPNLSISIVSESLPHLKRGCIRDFFRILDESPEDPNYNKTECRYSYPSGSFIEFFGADESAKVRGPRRDILFINEGNNVPWEAARGLDIRTNKFTFVDWNPVSEFWAHEYWIGQPENEYIHSTYLDAKPVLPEQVVNDIESYRDSDPNWWNIYGLGKIGKIEGLVYPQFEIIDRLPPGDFTYGLDFGFSGDPSCLTRNIVTEDSVYSQELIYDRGLTNQDIGKMMSELGLTRGGAPIWADSAEPKSIEELKRDGWNIKPVEKKPGSVEWRHQKVRQLKQFWTKDSLNCIKEQRNFRYVEDKLTGRLTEKTTHMWSHGMDSRDYAATQGKISGYGPTLVRF